MRRIEEFDPLEKIFTVENVSNDLESVTLAVYERFIYDEASELLEFIRTLPWEPTGYGQIIPFYWIEEIDRPFNANALSLDEYGYSMAQIYYLNRILEEADDRQAKRLFASVYRTDTGWFHNIWLIQYGAYGMPHIICLINDTS